MAKNAGSRVFFGFVVVLCVLLCIISIISFSTFAAEHNKIKKDVVELDRKYDSSRQDYCILYAESLGDVNHDDKDEIELGNDGPCAFAIWGQVTVCFVSVLLGILFTIKAVIGINALSCITLFETILVILTGLLDFVVAIVITAGLDETCGSFGTTQSTCDRAVLVFSDTGKKVEYYQNINTSKATAWIGTTILVVLALLHVVMVCGYFRKLRRPQDPPPYEPLHTEEDTNRNPAAV